MPYIDTKDVISQSFKNLMEKKSFDKITISDISDEAKINRQTFYYHFHDKYELLNTIFYNDVIVELIDGFSIDNWAEKFLTMLNTLKKILNSIKTPCIHLMAENSEPIYLILHKNYFIILLAH